MLCGGSTCINRGLYRIGLSAYHYSNEVAVGVLLTNKRGIGHLAYASAVSIAPIGPCGSIIPNAI